MFKTTQQIIIVVLCRLGIEPDEIQNDKVAVYRISDKLFKTLRTYQLI